MKTESEAINKQVRSYQLSAEWDHRDEAEFQHAFFDVINKRFFIPTGESLPQPVISMEPSRRRVEEGFYLETPNSIGLCHQINISEHTLDTLTRFQRAETLLHEAVHMWQAVHRPQTLPKTSWYHGKVWAAKAEEVGIVADQRTGCTLTIAEPFISLAREFGIKDPVPDYTTEDDFQSSGSIIVSPPRKGSPLKRWVCDCKPPVNLRVGRKRIRVKCLECHGVFRLSE